MAFSASLRAARNVRLQDHFVKMKTRRAFFGFVPRGLFLLKLVENLWARTTATQLGRIASEIFYLFLHTFHCGLVVCN